ncbi:hypothetical protein MUG84_08865 [Paenibacillus sp. KQZ6P-2]|uniref:Uncharacterized protein n=1 Tax=Paenibacillus mangrovi TaxID=2931978 RepID=A0A9X2B218_9BACL|nr:hypothetical protein [Paenibacillus mangrovi]MCJ8011851.1 hypothetical protein [Paenibacillus mangrovi]
MSATGHSEKVFLYAMIHNSIWADVHATAESILEGVDCKDSILLDFRVLGPKMWV